MSQKSGGLRLVAGALLLGAAAVISRSEATLSARNDVSALLIVVGASFVLWGVLILKRDKEEGLRRSRRESSEEEWGEE